MSVAIQLPAPMRRFVNGANRVEVEAATVGEAIEAFCTRHEALRDTLLKPNGRFKRGITIFVNNRQPPAEVGTAVAPGDTLVIVQPVGGG